MVFLISLLKILTCDIHVKVLLCFFCFWNGNLRYIVYRYFYLYKKNYGMREKQRNNWFRDVDKIDMFDIKIASKYIETNGMATYRTALSAVFHSISKKPGFKRPIRPDSSSLSLLYLFEMTCRKFQCLFYCVIF